MAEAVANAFMIVFF
ncbi:type I toxin-antitoxin system ptaRNA1 family toxin [Klebsiella pneumoniae]|nr:type I toxin-antitoxin system ptaRNA1 family toxin [Klebsiella pneumoniae]MCB3432907.1 type I toxin-antitoxin system ptaRNA1 family toxin [Klebsiella pneumoniae]HBS0023926.1 type I toxin-antitoxin system ptaRNA1 family toxin [Klebsiella pneumoniae]HBT5436670.1 hypothetical protein [Klebsiella pneumoniae]